MSAAPESLKPDRRWYQFSLRTLLIVVVVCSILAGNFQSVLNHILRHVLVSSFVIALILGAFGQIAGRRGLMTRRRFVARFGAACVGLLLILVLWSRHRWFEVYFDPGWPRPWPYPDSLLDAAHDWIDAHRPVPAGYFKITAEWHAVMLLLDALTILVSGACGALIGIVTAPVPIRRLISKRHG